MRSTSSVVSPARERLADRVVEGAALRQLGDHALDHVVLGDRARDVLGELAGQHAVGDLRHLRSKPVGGRLKWAAGGPSRGAGRVARPPADR